MRLLLYVVVAHITASHLLQLPRDTKRILCLCPPAHCLGSLAGIIFWWCECVSVNLIRSGNVRTNNLKYTTVQVEPIAGKAADKAPGIVCPDDMTYGDSSQALVDGVHDMMQAQTSSVEELVPRLRAFSSPTC